MPVDAWGKWSEARVALGRLHGFTYWQPVAIPIPRTPLGPELPGGDPWADSDAEAQAAAKAALKAADLPEWCLQVPSLPLPTITSSEATLAPENPTPPAPEEDWL